MEYIMKKLILAIFMCSSLVTSAMADSKRIDANFAFNMNDNQSILLERLSDNEMISTEGKFAWPAIPFAIKLVGTSSSL